jgi:hypothetical protein
MTCQIGIEVTGRVDAALTSEGHCIQTPKSTLLWRAVEAFLQEFAGARGPCGVQLGQEADPMGRSQAPARPDGLRFCRWPAIIEQTSVSDEWQRTVPKMR